MRLLEQTSFALQKRPVSHRVSNSTHQASSNTYTERFLSSLIALISIFLRPMTSTRALRRVLFAIQTKLFNAEADLESVISTRPICFPNLSRRFALPRLYPTAFYPSFSILRFNIAFASVRCLDLFSDRPCR
jgi:hypothetical protein